MAVLGTSVSTLLDVLQGLNPDGSQAAIAEVLNKTNPLLADIPWFEGNLPTGTRLTVRTSLPTPSARALNEGVPLTKSSKTQIDETCALIEDFSQVDREIAMLSGNVDAYRLREANPHLEGMNQYMASLMVYGNAATSPKTFTGLATRFNTKAGSPVATQIIDAGGTGSGLRSILLVGWGEGKVYGVYPKNTKGGLDHEDATNGGSAATMGAMSLADANGNLYMGYRDHWTWRCGLAVEDWRYVVRIVNIDPTLLVPNHSTGAWLQDLMIQALETIQSLDGVNPKFYMPRIVRQYLHRQLGSDKNAFLALDQSSAGGTVMAFGQVEVKRLDAMNVNETRVV